VVHGENRLAETIDVLSVDECRCESAFSRFWWKTPGIEDRFGEYPAIEAGRRKGKSIPARSPGQGQSPAGVERSESLDAGEHRDTLFNAGRVHERRQ
jgi:hypothetical protein